MKIEYVPLKTGSQLTEDLGINQQLQHYNATVCLAKMEQYTPMREGILSQTVEIEATSDFADITYISPYAHFQWQGDVMVADNGSAWAKVGETKHYNGEKLNYNTEMHPLATSHWDEAMWKSHAEEIVAMVDTERRRLSR